MANDGFPPTHADGRNTRQGRSKTEPKSVKANTEVMLKAASLRAAGATFREIGTALGIDYSYARTLILKALEAVPYEAADVMRTQEGERLDRLQRAHWQQAITGDVKAAQLVLRVMERRSKLFGLDAPVQVQVTDAVDHDEVDAALHTILGTLVTDEG